MALVTRMFTSLKAGEFRSTMVMSQFSSPKMVTLLFMPLTRVSGCVMRFFFLHLPVIGRLV